jgi:hypothetical protein
MDNHIFNLITAKILRKKSGTLEMKTERMWKSFKMRSVWGRLRKNEIFQ